MKKELYTWQEECLEQWFANNGRGIVQAVTGSGKTCMALMAASRMEKRLNQNLHIKIVVPTNALMHQWYKDLREFLSATCKEGKNRLNPQEEIGLRGGGYKSMSNRKYMIYVINSARYELARQILTELKSGEAVLLIADECHHYVSGQNQLIFEFLPYIKQYQNKFFSLGLSATLPSGQSQRYLTSVLGRKIYNYGMAEASSHHTVCPYNIYHVSLNFQPSEREMYENFSEQMTILYSKLIRSYPSLATFSQRERYELLRSIAGEKRNKLSKTASLYMNLSYKRKSLVCLASARVSCTCNLIKRMDSKEKILIFSERISQADELYQLLQQHYPEKVGRYHSKMGCQANKNVLERFRTNDIRILVTCKAVDEGINIPDASVGIIMSGTSTQRQHIQRLGRIIRKNNAKTSTLLYYLHIAETSEDSCFLPDIDKHHLFELTYDWENQVFINPVYDEKAALLLNEMQNADVGREKLQEAERCLQLGCVRPDWTLKPSDIELQIKHSKYTSDRNYWTCMKKLASER